MGMANLDLASRVLLRDANLIILDKPAGVPVHPGPGGKTSVEAGLPALTFGLRHVPALGHRLDQDTSGCLVLARHPKALSRLGRLFSAGAVGKTYWAVVEGGPAAETGEIDLPLYKETAPSGWRMVVDQARGQKSVTEWRVLARRDGIAWLALHPLTGRTHQIRVHLAASGWPILGDPFYGKGGRAMQLHSRRIEVPYWEGRPPVVAEAPLPPHFLPVPQLAEA
jgi:tRNA pseudouridine32 synthase/23S rRNA pseudouridine746 synthase